MPRVWARFPQARLRVVAGPDPERHWQDFLKRPFPIRFDPRIELHAFVADVLPLYQQASVVAVPLLVSAGTNIKVMEAMACEKPVVSTPIGCHGLHLLDGLDALIRDSSEAFADAIVELLADGGLREQIGLQGRRTVEARFSWESIADAAYGSYERIMARAVP
jgi:glycosyltransferase involved in cell wall biosynthesis